MKPIPGRVAALRRREQARFVASHPRSAAQAASAAGHWLHGLPMHWMRDWPLPHPLFVRQARRAEVTCVDGLRLADFCLGDTGAMFGHDPQPVMQALARADAGLTTMLPAESLAAVGASLARVFGLPRWQLALSASDANRFVLRWARAVTGRARILVFDGCYHGTVDDTLVDRGDGGRTLARASLLGQVHDLALGTVVVPFNDLDAVERALSRGDVACVLTEPALTNCGLVPPRAGFVEGVRDACTRHGALLVLDETHTISSGLGGWARANSVKPDVLVVGKALAGGVPCAAYGFGDELAARMQRAKDAAPPGHSGIGTTLAASALSLRALQASLDGVMTAQAYRRMAMGADHLQRVLQRAIDRAAVPWCVTRLGARMELQFASSAPDDALAARRAMDPVLESLLQLYLLNRGTLLTPFHNMLLVSPVTAAQDIERVGVGLGEFLDELGSAAFSRG